MDNITFQDFVLKLSLHTTIIKHNSNPRIQNIHKKMEQKLPVMAKKFWNIIRVAYFMLRKNISKPKFLLADLNMMMKRGKLAGKAAIHNLMFHHHHQQRLFHNSRGGSSASDDGDLQIPSDEHELSSSNTPAHDPTIPLPLDLDKRKQSPSPSHPSAFAEIMEIADYKEAEELALAVSPALPGFGRTPTAREPRMTDSPSPLIGIEEDDHVDEAAEKFIMKFYRELERQTTMAS